MGIQPGQDSSRSAIVIVAHPDDEIIWCGGLILQNPDWNWSILCLSRKDDPDRCPKFHRVCDFLSARGYISDLDDSDPLEKIDPRSEIGSRIVENLNPARWDLCITHGSNGEYGHQRHREVHAEVLDLIRDGMLECKELWTFAYDCDLEAKTCHPGTQAEMIVNLSDAHLSEKRRIVRELYGYAEDSFEVSVCISPEGFRKWELSHKEQLS
jgi:LmbE family N-acetylglucosaminyl deacetylase